jgi:NADPH:quinone reductase-like Zn-dependent oxidoreductase
VLTRKGGPFEIHYLPTPEPGDDELLIEVKAFSVAPLELFQRDYGFPSVAQYPAVIGSDIAGLVNKIGSAVPKNIFKAGARIGALTATFIYQGKKLMEASKPM